MHIRAGGFPCKRTNSRAFADQRRHFRGHHEATTTRTVRTVTETTFQTRTEDSTDRTLETDLIAAGPLETGPLETGPLEIGPVEIALEFSFDAAHHFPQAPEGHIYRRLHGHSFQVEVAIIGTPDPVMGFVADFARLETAVQGMHHALDHRLLNEVPGLSAPSLENLALWVWQRLSPQFDGLNRVVVRRPSCRQSCTYRGPTVRQPHE